MGTKKRVFVFLIAILMVAVVLSCKKETEKVQLRLRLKGGESYKLRMTTEQKISQTIQGRQQEMAQTTGIVYTFDVEDVDAEGTALVKATYDSVVFRQDGPMGRVEYDSSNPPPVVPPMARGFAALVGQGFSMMISPEGYVKDVQGVNAMLTRMIEQLELPEGPVRASMEKILREQFGDRALKEMMENSMAIYPDGPVGVGDSWTRRVVISRGFPMVLDNTWTLKSRKDGIAFIDVRSTIKSDPERAPVGMGSVGLSYDISGTQAGTMELKEATGWIIRTKLTQQLSGKVKLKSPQKTEGISWPISIESTVSSETFER